MRTRISLIEKCHMMHDILNDGSDVMDSAFMCIEIFLTLLMLYNVDIPTAKANFNIETLFNADVTCKKDSQGFTLLQCFLDALQWQRSQGGHTGQ